MAIDGAGFRVIAPRSEPFYGAKEAEIRIPRWPVEYNNIRRHRRAMGSKPWLQIQRLKSRSSPSDDHDEWRINCGSLRKVVNH